MSRRTVCKLELLASDCHYNANETEITITAEHQKVQICFHDPKTLLIKGNCPAELIVTQNAQGWGYDYAYKVDREQPLYILNLNRCNRKYIVQCLQGSISIQQNWEVETSSDCKLLVSPTSGGFLLALREMDTDRDIVPVELDYDVALASMRQNFEDFYSGFSHITDESDLKRLAIYVLWSSIVAPSGKLKREAMYMSKNYMTSVWSWDHCFNAVALGKAHAHLAMEQFLIMFDTQDEAGMMADFVCDEGAVYNFCKPPVHGMMLSIILQCHDYPKDVLQEIYIKLEKWTNFWLKYRMSGGLFEYHHGNDCGWDNSSVFAMGPLVKSPDAIAFLVLQAEMLSQLAAKLDNHDGRKYWERMSQELMEKLGLLYNENGFYALGEDNRRITCDSLLLYLPIVLGQRLPDYMQASLLQGLQRFETVFGYATEALGSNAYIPDGYWRGPIWAPSAMIISEGLHALGEAELAFSLMSKFVMLIKNGGFAENFDAISGAGLRDNSYTWTASVYLYFLEKLQTMKEADLNEV